MQPHEITKEKIMKNCDKVICVGESLLQTLLVYGSKKAPMYYTMNQKGKTNDIYVFDGKIAICTGTEPFGNVFPTHKLTTVYEAKAIEMMDPVNDMNYVEKMEMVEYYLEEFIKKAIAKYDI